MTDIASIARGLTKVQREAVHREGISDETMATVKALLRKKLMYLHIDSPNGRCGFMKLTDLGAQIRQYLLENPDV